MKLLKPLHSSSYEKYGCIFYLHVLHRDVIMKLNTHLFWYWSLLLYFYCKEATCSISKKMLHLRRNLVIKNHFSYQLKQWIFGICCLAFSHFTVQSKNIKLYLLDYNTGVPPLYKYRGTCVPERSLFGFGPIGTWTFLETILGNNLFSRNMILFKIRYYWRTRSCFVEVLKNI